MTHDLPDNIEAIIESIDQQLKADEVPPHARPIWAVIRAAAPLGVLMLPIIPLHQGDAQYGTYPDLISRRIHDWYREHYGDRLNFDPSANARVAVVADGDVWIAPLPIIFGGLVAPSRNMPDPAKAGSPSAIFNPCAHLVGITAARLKRFSNEDLNEIVSMFNLGTAAREAFFRFRKYDTRFAKADSDWASATMHLTAQTPDYGQSHWSSSQMAEKFMKAMIDLIGEGNPKQRHDLSALFEELEKSIPGIADLRHLIDRITCTSSVRYEDPSNRRDAYAAHKASLELVGALGTVGYPDYHASRENPR